MKSIHNMPPELRQQVIEAMARRVYYEGKHWVFTPKKKLQLQAAERILKWLLEDEQ